MKHKEIILLSGSMFIIVVAWIGFSIYHNLVKSTTPESLEKEALPIKATFDEPVIRKLKERAQISPLYRLESSVPSITPSPTIPELSPTLTPSPPASPSPTIESPTPTATPEGGIIP